MLQEQLALAQQKRELQHLVTVTRNLQESHPSGRTTSEFLRILYDNFTDYVLMPAVLPTYACIHALTHTHTAHPH